MVKWRGLGFKGAPQINKMWGARKTKYSLWRPEFLAGNLRGNEVLSDSRADSVWGWEPPVCHSPPLLSLYKKGCHYTVIGWDRNAPSCFHSSIRSQAPHLCTGDLNPLQLVMRENQHKLRNTASQIIGLLKYKRRKSWGAHGGTVTNTSWASFRAHFSSCLFFAKFENENKNLQHQTCQTTSVFYHELSPHLVFNPFSCG